MSKTSAPTSLFSVPDGQATNVRIIDTTSYVKDTALSAFLGPPMSGYSTFSVPAFSFLVEHASGRKILFDLGIRKDYWNMSPTIVSITKDWNVKVEKNVSEILVENGVDLAEIEAVIWSHWHWDHIGDLSTFPPSTKLICGPGFTETFIPGYPENADSPIQVSDYQGRELLELYFTTNDNNLKIGGFNAIDYFGDGSFYILDSPGHAIGHLCGLVRTKSSCAGPDSFIFMGADSCHHGGALRPSEHIPFPDSFLPNPLDASSSIPCPGAVFEALLKRNGRTTDKPFFEIPHFPDGEGFFHDVEESRKTLTKVQKADATDDVFVVLAHDDSLLGIVDFFPKEANAWREKGWGKSARWAFLKYFGKVVQLPGTAHSDT